ncbi:hypothetical protein [Marinobacter sp. AN1]|uniref:hypothetical protein n=1 Tax=Marinobacter sp. AN1 TaxID=2886046 RepID=UPI00222F4FA3|nr:hypothetical protein [Marinobacter sp. AN1]UZD65586.1 hypothetical protein LJ360_18755 [Marinobacter sp. AN1]
MHKILITILILTLGFPAVSAGQELDRQQVLLGLLGGEFSYKSREARTYGLELFEGMVGQLEQSVKAPTPSESDWVKSEVQKIGNLDTNAMAKALGDLNSNPIYIQRRIETFVSESEYIFSQIRSSESDLSEAYWWVQLSQTMLRLQDSEPWAQILVRADKSYAPISRLSGTMRAVRDLPGKANLVALSILAERRN